LSKRVAESKRGAAFPALIIHQANPAYFMPGAIEALKTSPLIASFSPFMDETTEMADLILPDHTYLESWNIHATPLADKQAIVTVTQPVVKPEFDTRQTADVLIALSREFGGASAHDLQSAEQVVKRAIGQLPRAAGGANSDEAEDFLKTVLEQGVWSGEVTGKRAAPEAAIETRPRFSLLSADNLSTADEYPLTLLAYEHAALGFGEQANLPWLQELPDPMTSVMWGSWVEINPKTAASLGIADGDLVEVTSPQNSLRAPAVLYPAIRPDVIATPYGQGHTAYGRYARARGANAALLNTFSGDEAARPDAVRVKISKVAGEAGLIRFGTDLLEKIENDRPR
jgi:anaerobic selenocysteine-containing dehydrogenase